MKRLSVGIIGIPIKFEKINNLLKESFVPRLTDSLRLKTKKFIEGMSKEKKIQVSISDLGELVDSHSLLKRGKLIGISKEGLDRLAQEFKRRIKDVDFVVVYGEAHTGAYLLYHLPGRVERYDIHEDDQEAEIPFHTSYMRYAIELKDSSQVSNHLWHDLLNGILETNKPVDKLGKVFDIDVDYFTPTEFCRLKEEDVEDHFKRIKLSIQRARPRVIGLFECQELIGAPKGEERLLNLTWGGLIVNLKSI